MPKLTVYYPQRVGLTNDQFNMIKGPLQRLIAESASTEQSPLTEEHVDFVPISYDDESAQFSQLIAIEIETLGFPFRKAKMTEEAMTALKPLIKDILGPVGWHVDLNKPLVWLKFQDPAGSHV